MNRSWIIWSVFFAAVILVVGVFGWITSRALDSEREGAQAEAEVLAGERMRVALTSMDELGMSILATENQRPVEDYQSVSVAANYVAQSQQVAMNDVYKMSSLLMGQSDYSDVYFEIDSLGNVSSPQVLTASDNELASNSGFEIPQNKRALQKIDRMQGKKTQVRDFKKIFKNEGSDDGEGALVDREVYSYDKFGSKGGQSLASKKTKSAPLEYTKKQKPSKTSKYSKKVMTGKKVAEKKSSKKSQNWKESDNFTNKEMASSYNMERSRQTLSQRASRKSRMEESIMKNRVDNAWAFSNTNFAQESYDSVLSITSLVPSWDGDELKFVRKVRRNSGEIYQGFTVNREKLERELRADLPEGDGFRLIRGDQAPSGAERLVSLPYAVVTPPVDTVLLPLITPMRKTLAAGWVAGLLSLLAIGALVSGVMKLSERRAAFVSSVTHELRTPLTTFRLYSEMLADGMVKDEAKKKNYLETMVGESERLNHLVENVLSYSKIERGNARSKKEELAVADLVERMRPVLQRRVDQEDAALSVEVSEEVGRVETDVSAVEQILFNLVDNACKYGLPEGQKGRVILDVKKKGGKVLFEVRDEGRGIAKSERKKLFRAFHKSALEAAHDKPGVGLGLALCRRLAKALGGDLKLGKVQGQGASFILELGIAAA